MMLAGCAVEQHDHPILPRAPRVEARGGLEGDYFFASKRPSGVTDGGRARMTERPSAYDVAWTENAEASAVGFAVQVGAVLAVVKGNTPKDFWNDHEDLGVAIFDIRADGMWGVRVFAGDPLGRGETRRYRPLAGTPDMFETVSEAGSPHVDNWRRLKVTRNGDAYLFAWYEPRLTFIGTGVRFGGRYIVGITSTNLPDVAAYCRVGDTLRGVGVSNAQRTLSEETLRRAERYWLSDEMESDLCAGWLAEYGIR